MAVLDGKYEIISQHSLSESETIFDAVAPDGMALRIAWFELGTAQEEVQFERYRQLLRKLEREGLAAIYDIVSRPGMHYVAWYTPGKTLASADPELENLLAAYNYTPNQADIRLEKDKAVVYNLAFNAAVVPRLEPVQPQAETAKVKPFVLLPGLRQWGIGILLMLAGVGMGLLGFKLRANDRLVVVPDVIGQDINVALEHLYRLRLEVEAQPASSDKPAGTVLSVEPEVSTDLRPGRKVMLTYAVASGQVSQVQVPQLGGEIMSGDIQKKLEQASLNLGRVVYIHAKVPQDIIISQSPEANTRTDAGTEVNVLVSLGATGEKLYVPDLVGRSYSEALDLINLAGLPAPKVEKVMTTQYLPDTVIAQSIAAHMMLSQPSVLELKVATQKPLEVYNIPALVGLSLEQARQIASGFSLNIQEISTPNLPQGVVDQSPEPGPKVSSVITLVVNVAPVPIPVPSPFVTLQEPKARVIRYQFYIEAGISKNSYAQLVAEDVRGQRNIIAAKYVSEGEYLEGVWETTTVGPITFTLYLNNLEYQRQTLNP